MFLSTSATLEEPSINCGRDALSFNFFPMIVASNATVFQRNTGPIGVSLKSMRSCQIPSGCST